MVKAVALFSGGMDSALAIKLIQEQNIEVVALNFVSPFCTCKGEDGCSVADLGRRLGVKTEIRNKGMEYLRIVRHPKHGYGAGINPCIDCKIFILKKAKRFAREIGADFIFTGEVLGQRPMSQTGKLLGLIEREAGLKGQIVRPLSGAILDKTVAEKRGLVDRSRFLSIEGRRRNLQMDLARKLKIDGFLCGGPGCRLTNKDYARKLKDLFRHMERISLVDVILLNYGRHFRVDNTKIIVGRNERDNNALSRLRKKGDYLFTCIGVNGPTALLSGKKSNGNIELTAELVARYSDSDGEFVDISYSHGLVSGSIRVRKRDDVFFKSYWI